MSNTEKRGLHTKSLILTALSAAFISVCSWITVPAAVPFTLQTFAIFCIAGIFGGKLGTNAVLVYILLGAVGLPVFSGFRGGAGVLFGATGGYIIGFVVFMLLYRTITAAFGTGAVSMLAAMLCGMLFCYAFGTLWFITIYTEKGGIDFFSALKLCVLPFLLFDAIKLAAAFFVIRSVRAKLPDICVK